jgi:hypothetical protein
MDIGDKMREWTALQVKELYVCIGAIIHMRVHEEPEVSIYWKMDFNKGPLHPIPDYIPLCRFSRLRGISISPVLKEMKRKAYFN